MHPEQTHTIIILQCTNTDIVAVSGYVMDLQCRPLDCGAAGSSGGGRARTCPS